MIAVIAEQHDDGVAAMRPVVQRIEHAADLVIHERHAGQIGPDAFAELLVAVALKEVEPGVLGQRVDAAADLRNVAEVVIADRRQLHLLQRKQIEPLLRDVKRNVRPDKPDGEKERFVVFRGEAFHGPVGRLVVAHLVVPVGEGSPVGLRAGPRHIGQMVVETPPAGRLWA